MAVPLMIAGAAMSVMGAVSGAKQADASAKYNAGLQRKQAYETLRAAAHREELMRENASQDAATQRAALSANGIDPTSGTALLGIAQGMRDSEMDALMARYEGVVEARNIFQGAEATRLEGRAAKRQAYFSAAGQLAMSAGSYMAGGFGKGNMAPVETRTPTVVRPF